MKQINKEAIEFAEWIAQYQYDRCKDGLWRYWDNGIGEHTTEELFEIFKKESKVDDKITESNNAYGIVTDIYPTDDKDISIAVDNSLRYVSECYVEVPYPVIEWKEEMKLSWYEYYPSIKVGNIEVSLTDIIFIAGKPDRDSLILYFENKEVFEGTLKECEEFANNLVFGIKIPYPIIDLTGLKQDGYTFICPIHGLHPNCDCQEGQIKVFSEGYVEKNLPIIEWKEIEDVKLDGYISIFRFCYITKDKRDFSLHSYNSILNSTKLFEGTLKECKLKADKLLYGITE